jgi:hypothetical protein
MPKIERWNNLGQQTIYDGGTLTAGGILEDIVDKETGEHEINRFILLLTATLINPDGSPLRNKYGKLNPVKKINPVLLDKKSPGDKRLNEIIIESVNYKDAKIEDVVKDLAKKNRKLNWILGIDELECESVPHLTLKLSNISCLDLLRYISLKTGLQYRFEKNFLTLGNSSIQDMDTRFFPVRSALITRIAPMAEEEDNLYEEEDFFDCNDISENFPLEEKYQYSESLKTYFTERGITFPEGSTINYSRKNEKLLVKNTEQNLIRVKKLLECLDLEIPEVMIESTMVEISNKDLIDLIGLEAALSDSLTQKQIEKIIDSEKGRIIAEGKVTAHNGEAGIIVAGNEVFYPESWYSPEAVIEDGYIHICPPVPEFGEGTILGGSLETTPEVSPDNHTISLSLRFASKKMLGWSKYDILFTLKKNGKEEIKTNVIKMPIIEKRLLYASLKIYNGSRIMAGRTQLLDLSCSSQDSDISKSEMVKIAEKKKKKLINVFHFIKAKIVNLQDK